MSCPRPPRAFRCDLRDSSFCSRNVAENCHAEFAEKIKPRYSLAFLYQAQPEGNGMATGYVGGGRMVAHNMVTTQFELDGFRVTRTLGVVRGIVVRSRSIFGTIGAGLQTLVGGNITLLTNLCEKTRSEAFDLMLQHAAELGGNAVVGARYDATEIMQGVTEVLAYGTAVYVEPAK